MEIEKITEGLNQEQADAVLHDSGPLLILAGAGSGKTRVLTHRAANLILSGKCKPNEILAVTFTNKAAREMEARVTKLLHELDVPLFEPLWISTFHSICVRILRSHIDLLEYEKSFAIYDSSDQLAMVKKVMQALNINEKMYPAKAFQSKINHCKMQALRPDDIQKLSNFNFDDRDLQVFKRYEEDMKSSNALDFGDLLLKVYDLFTYYPVVLEEFQEKFKYIMVDEYQDTNKVQYLIVNMLAQKSKNICVVGDEDQSIYSWRGADISNILSFESDFPDSKVVKLEKNYRSTKTIVTAATHVIKNNSQRKNKVLHTDNEAGDKIIVKEERTDYDEARYVISHMRDQLATGKFSFNDVAVFYRTNAQSRLIEEQLRSNSIPYKIVGGIKFYERAEIKDILAYMRLILTPNDDISFKRVINTPARGIGKTTVEKIQAIANEQRIPLVAAAPIACENKVFHGGAIKKVTGFLRLIENLRIQGETLTLSQIFQLILDDTGYAKILKDQDTPESRTRLENLEELDNALVQFEEERDDEATLQSFLEEMALVSDIDTMEDEGKSVTLMTLHISKGLEFPLVYIVGMEEGLFPTGRAVEADDPTAIEEERRLAYVGMTRAQKKLVLTYARSRRLWGHETYNPPSRFIAELPEEYIDSQTSFKRPKLLDRIRSADKASSDPFPDYENAGNTHDSVNEYQKGLKVKHPTFGVGSVLATEGSGQSMKIKVVFSDNSVKKFVAKYARLEKLDYFDDF
jgi:DNA helicase-2/ATP-dependent DNA helicase PcrA